MGGPDPDSGARSKTRLAMPDQLDNRTRRPRLHRWGLAALGVLSVGLGAVGVFVPGLPTTIFLIVATYCFARSCPWLEERLLRRRLFAPYMRFVDGGEPMPRRAQVVAMLLMWMSVVASIGLLHVTGRLGPWLAALIVGAAATGTGAIYAAGRRRHPGATDDAGTLGTSGPVAS